MGGGGIREEMNDGECFSDTNMLFIVFIIQLLYLLFLCEDARKKNPWHLGGRKAGKVEQYEQYASSSLLLLCFQYAITTHGVQQHHHRNVFFFFI